MGEGCPEQGSKLPASYLRTSLGPLSTLRAATITLWGMSLPPMRREQIIGVTAAARAVSSAPAFSSAATYHAAEILNQHVHRQSNLALHAALWFLRVLPL